MKVNLFIFSRSEKGVSSCDEGVEIISESLADYDGLIRSWHRKAKRGDYFSKFIFEFLAFIAHLKNNIAFEAQFERQAIQSLKQHTGKEKIYLDEINETESFLRDARNLVHPNKQVKETSYPTENTANTSRQVVESVISELSE